ncbi:S41 family peptidase [Mucilaginibacter sp. RS28]|uniref:S41 family peptidase n=1 Tax=Mucilaginibacter straminoryzae TaxID=2932774 RepID=A0A9X2BAT7_9SPHI|nr:S41 family peptidase [Mucilaginibacter straminoryzae]MCJ8211110.1 S41 family peptidase [Mucilaginibacter straminoryzae]
MKKYFLPLLLIGFASTFQACKKDKATTPATTASGVDKLKDSVFYYAKEDYYWYSSLPDYNTFNPHSFTGSTDLEALQNEVNKLSQYAINPSTGKAYEYYDGTQAKYSFIDDGAASQRLNAVTGDFGFAPIYAGTNDLRVKYVYAGSPAGLAGLKRGDRITVINGRTSFPYDNGGPNSKFIIDAYTNSSTISMTIQHLDGTTANVNLTTATYTINPVITSKIITLSNGKKLGYIVFNSFITLDKAKAPLDAAFANFQSNGIDELAVDLRYNGGGYVETAEYLCNLIAPASTSGKVMYKAYYNDILTSKKAVLLRNQVRKSSSGQTYNLYDNIDYSLNANTTTFGTAHGLNLSRVFFIVTGSTASASELTINSLRPYLNVQLVGRTTYGKPVGFFDIKIDKYEMYIPEFETKNANAQGGYYSGMAPGTTDYPGKDAGDDAVHEFGDTSENLLANVKYFLENGVYKTATTSVQSLGGTTSMSVEQQSAMSVSLESKSDRFKGLIYQKVK